MANKVIIDYKYENPELLKGKKMKINYYNKNLSPRENEILEDLLDGLNNSEIAKKRFCFLNPETHKPMGVFKNALAIVIFEGKINYAERF